MYTSIRLQAAQIKMAVIEIMARATKSALDLGNFPLSVCDVQCAYDAFLQDRQNSHVDPTMASAIRYDLARLGY